MRCSWHCKVKARFYEQLEADGKAEEYMTLLRESFNPTTVDKVMCRNQITVNWDGIIHDCDLNLALNMAETLAAEEGVDISIWHTGCGEEQVREIAPGEYSYREQQGPDLGTRMSYAFEEAFEDGFDRVALWPVT